MPIATLPTTYSDGNVLAAADLNNNFTTLNNATVPVASGGTGLTSGTSGGVLAFTASGTIASSGALTANAIVIGGGAGAAPSAMTGTSGGVPYFNATTTVASSALLAANLVVLGGGAGAAPATMTDPNADRIVFWDDSAGTTTFLTAGAGLAIAGTTMTATFGREGGNTTEGTTTSTTQVDLVDVTGLNIAAATPVLIVSSVRKTTGAASASRFGIQLNTVDAMTPAQGPATASGNIAQSGILWALLHPRVASYGSGGMYGFAVSDTSANASSNVGVVIQGTANTSALTGVTITGLSGDAAVTTAADDVHVYSLGTS